MLLTQYKEAIENSNIVSKTDTDGVINFVNDEQKERQIYLLFY